MLEKLRFENARISDAADTRSRGYLEGLYNSRDMLSTSADRSAHRGIYVRHMWCATVSSVCSVQCACIVRKSRLLL